MSIVNPKDLLLPYQRRWVDDPSRYKIGIMSRQIGKSMACAEECVEACYKTPKDFWVALSAGERQVLEFMRKVKEWAEAFDLAIHDYNEDRAGKDVLIKSAEVTFPNGARILGIPANPDTARGYSANLVLDEFAFHEKPDEIWRAIFPAISNPLRGLKKVRVVSTPNGRGNKFYTLTQNRDYSVHKVTIHDAVAQGLGIDVDQLKQGLADPEGWAQEYECEFLDGSSILLPYDIISACEHPEATAVGGPVGDTRAAGIVLGIDFGRKKDLTVAWTLQREGDVWWTREVLELRGMPTQDQAEILRSRIQRASRVCMDYTGPGIGLGDLLVGEFQELNPDKHQWGKVELCNFTNTLKNEIFGKLRMRFDERLLRVPVSREIREDLHSVHRTVTPSGNIAYRAPHTDDGHADRTTALALAVRATTHTEGGRVTINLI